MQVTAELVQSGTLLDNQGNISFHRARIIALEVLRAMVNEDGSFPGISELTMRSIANRLAESSTKLRRDR